MYRSYSKFLEELQVAIRKRYDEGNPQEIKNDLKILSEKFQIEFAEADSARKSIEKKMLNEWVIDNTDTTTAGAYGSQSSFAKVAGRINLDIARAVDRGLRKNMSMQEISTLVQRVGVLGKSQSRTVGRTAVMGKIRSEYLLNHLQAGCREFKYSGPAGASSSADRPRKFCQEHLGKIYTIEELLRLDNGQGLPVLIYLGGYNCRHRLEAVYR